jgi:hypothetical protein
MPAAYLAGVHVEEQRLGLRRPRRGRAIRKMLMRQIQKLSSMAGSGAGGPTEFAAMRFPSAKSRTLTT